MLFFVFLLLTGGFMSRIHRAILMEMNRGNPM